jgi:hypothetical protein
VPPGVALPRVAVCDWHNVIVPVIADGSGNTEKVIVAIQEEGVVYVIVVVPGAGVAETPPAMPVANPTLPIAGVLLDHVPPATGCDNVVVRPWHTELAPTIAAGAGVTVTTSVEIQPALNPYVIVVVPVAMPVNTPVDGSIVPTAGVLLDHVPPDAVVV